MLVSSNVILVKPLFWKAYCPILVTLAGIVILVNPLQDWNALIHILVKLVHLLRSTLVNPLQNRNASSPILVKLLDRLILVNPSHS